MNKDASDGAIADRDRQIADCREILDALAWEGCPDRMPYDCTSPYKKRCRWLGLDGQGWSRHQSSFGFCICSCHLDSRE